MSIFTKYPFSSFLSRLTPERDIMGQRSRIDELFSYIDGMEDKHFASELDRDPHSRIWEMLVAMLLKTAGHKVSSANCGPDFQCTMSTQRVFIEAVCPSLGQEGHPDAVAPMQPGGTAARMVPVDQLTLRVTAAISAKTEKYRGYLKSGLVSKSDCLLIALSAAKFGGSGGFSPPLAARALLGCGSPYVVIDGKTGQKLREGIDTQTFIQKSNREEICTIPFLNNSMPEISGVIYSEASPLSLPYRPFEETVLIHNPTANIPLPRGFMKQVREIWTIHSPADQHWKIHLLDPAT